jgi:hypothetical protein
VDPADLGKHAGRTLPEIVVADADYFFLAVANHVFTGRLAAEAEEADHPFRKAAGNVRSGAREGRASE